MTLFSRKLDRICFDNLGMCNFDNTIYNNLLYVEVYDTISFWCFFHVSLIEYGLITVACVIINECCIFNVPRLILVFFSSKIDDKWLKNVLKLFSTYTCKHFHNLQLVMASMIVLRLENMTLLLIMCDNHMIRRLMNFSCFWSFNFCTLQVPQVPFYINFLLNLRVYFLVHDKWESRCLNPWDRFFE